ncbi:unnamed protein product [Leptidea sinapis]|uniref:Peptidase M12B domain-containing protein n=1 Tax=Leptidea sinapis TaxID=189913 RepID=A0A5E4QF76_9NEOP|nr:unnamed protein product [Leptidea sinapis]
MENLFVALYRNGVCSISKSCTLIEWVPRNMAYLLAHEIAHSFGVYHDGPPFNKCNSEKYIMAPRYVPTKQAGRRGAYILGVTTILIRLISIQFKIIFYLL